MMGKVTSVIDGEASFHVLTASLKICQAELISPRAVVRLQQKFGVISGLGVL
jgi:hypothetical protein